MKRYNSTSQFTDITQNLRSNSPVAYRNTIYPSIPISIRDTYVETGFGDRLDILARIFYQKESLWWIIAAANPDKISFDSLSLPSGLQIRIPADSGAIVQAFNKLNEGMLTMGNIPDIPLVVSAIDRTEESNVGDGGGGY